MQTSTDLLDQLRDAIEHEISQILLALFGGDIIIERISLSQDEGELTAFVIASINSQLTEVPELTILETAISNALTLLLGKNITISHLQVEHDDSGKPQRVMIVGTFSDGANEISSNDRDDAIKQQSFDLPQIIATVVNRAVDDHQRAYEDRQREMDKKTEVRQMRSNILIGIIFLFAGWLLSILATPTTLFHLLGK